jgi:rubrerythrin
MPVVAAEYVTVVANLLTAFEAEMNANVRYAAFAARASGDAFRGVASLFRAAARAEQIHAGSHGRVLRQFGGEIDYEIRPVEVKTTLENLRTSLRGEKYEVDTMYPVFLAEARACKDTAAICSFNWALEAEKTHARLFSETIYLVEIGATDGWIGATRQFYVCPVCGYTSECADERDRCRVCNCSWKKFEVNR